MNATDSHYSSAPMKALASEIVRKLGSRLKWLAIKVRELTGKDVVAVSASGFYRATPQATCR